MNIESFNHFLATGEFTPAEDAAPSESSANPAQMTDLQKHDAKYHKTGYKKGDKCKYRENLAKGDDADNIDPENVAGEQMSESSANAADIQSLHDIRDRLEPIARLLNGRTGNLPALQSSSRFQALSDYPSSNDFNELGRLMKSDDPAIAKAANDLATIANNISASAANNWNTPAGMVPPASALPALSAAPSGGSVSPSSHKGGKFSDDDAKALLFRAAKSVNHHIDKGDNTPNPKAIANLHAAEQDIRSLGDKQLEGLMDDIFASESAGFTQKIGNVPAPSAAWQQAHAPKMPSGGLGGLLGALFGGMGGGAPAAPKGPATTKKNPWTPFQAPSKYANALAAINANHPAATDPDYWKNKADAMTPQQAVQDMEAKGYIEKNGFRDAFDPNDPDDADMWADWKPSQKLSADVSRIAAISFDDLRSRFPNMQWPNKLEVRSGEGPVTKITLEDGSTLVWKTSGRSVHDMSDSRHGVLFGLGLDEVMSGYGLGRGNYGHNDHRQPFDILRHEMGHAIMSGELPNGKRKMTLFHDVVSAAYGNPATDLFDFERKYISSYAVTDKGRGPSISEGMAEMFAVITSPDYKPGYLPPEIEKFFCEDILGLKPDA